MRRTHFADRVCVFVPDDFVTPLSTPPNEAQSQGNETQTETQTQQEATKKDSSHLLSDAAVLDRLYEKWVTLVKLSSFL